MEAENPNSMAPALVRTLVIHHVLVTGMMEELHIRRTASTARQEARESDLGVRFTLSYNLPLGAGVWHDVG